MTQSEQLDSDRGLLPEDHSEIDLVPQATRDVWNRKEVVIRCVHCGERIWPEEKARRVVNKRGTFVGWEHARKRGC